MKFLHELYEDTTGGIAISGVVAISIGIATTIFLLTYIKIKII